ncbi:lipase 3-like [Harmonia axyridis]|uniref:lipase 3-like n=1 Tax=Harmonia axyridis TaxID=115357 RepID=UPI001E2793A8|nr:lipase 3-like [Harmonia axyridis]XP_045479567.1 lipase 3-like [Harmonia axyridis]XP_045479568.1 lipase 3-like [Harmonia axyridis]
MIGKNLLSAVLTLSFLWATNAEFENNVCPSLWDYPTMKDNPNCWYDFAAESKVPDIIKKTGYPFQEFKVQTKDGYILTLFRIPSIHSGNSGKGPVFMLHGIQSTAAIFVSLGRHSIAFLLADAGYDVWLGNYRGTEYSEGHATLNVTDRKFWDYGADEIGLYDVPAMLSMIKQHTRRRDIIYIGHSLGTTAALMYASEYPEAARNTVKLFVFLSPAYKLSNIPSPYKILFPLLKPFMRVTSSLNVVQLLSRGYSRRLTGSTCLASTALMLLCLHAINIYLGPWTQIAPETLPVYFNQLPGGTSLKTLTYVTEASKGKFTKYDYGRGRNMIKYGTPEPPEYNITKITVPIVIYFARNDWATPKKDAINLYNTLPNRIRYGLYEVPAENFNHFDFLFGRNVKELVYDHLLKLLGRVSETDDLLAGSEKKN